MSALIRLYSEYKKAARAFTGSVLLWAYAAKDDGISGDEWWGLAFIVAIALGVIDAANTPKTEPRHRVTTWGEDRGAVEPGSLALGLVLGIVLMLLLGADWRR